MDVKFISTIKSKIDNLAIVNGQLIALTDSNCLYYDLEGTRRMALHFSDEYTRSMGTAADRVAASSYAVSQCYSALLAKHTWIKYSSTAGFNSGYVFT